MKEVQLVLKACCILSCQALPASTLFLCSQGDCLSSLGERHGGLLTCRAPATGDRKVAVIHPASFGTSERSAQERWRRGGVLRSQGGGLGGRVLRERLGTRVGSQRLCGRV